MNKISLLLCIIIFFSLNITTALVALIILVPGTKDQDSAQNIAFWLTIPFSLILTLLARKYSKEYDVAQKIMNTPKVKYGWWGLLIGLGLIGLMYFLAFLPKFLKN